MIAYMIILVAVFLAGIIFIFNRVNSKKSKLNKIYLGFTAVTLILFCGLRGDFTSDYRNYKYLFDFYNNFNLYQLFSYQFGQERGYVILSWLIGRFTDNVVWLMIATSIVIITLYFKEIDKRSANVWLSVLLFVTIGQYYIAFNLTRQIIAAGIIFVGSEFLYKKRFFKYCTIVLVATLFHKTSLIIIPFYFILNFKFNYKKLFIGLLLILLISNYIDVLLGFIQQYFYAHYLVNSYGMSGFGYKNIVLPLGILLMVLFNKSIIQNENDNVLNVWINSMIFYAFFSFLGTNIQMIERLSHFFAPYVLLVIPEIVSNQKSKHLRILYYVVIIVGSIMYNYITLSGSGYDPYYFIWSIR